MNDQLFQQAEQFFKPITDIMALNARTFEALAEKQTGLMSDMWNDGITYAKDLSDKKDVKSFYESQKEYWDGVHQKFNSTARDSYNLLSEAQEEMSKLVQDSISSVDIPSVVEPFMQSAYSAQDRAQRTTQNAAESAAKATEKTVQKTQSQAAKAASKTAQAAATGALGGGAPSGQGSAARK